eukprot:scaffold86_cov338-Pavlova_lutheri.AAC.29
MCNQEPVYLQTGLFQKGDHRRARLHACSHRTSTFLPARRHDSSPPSLLTAAGYGWPAPRVLGGFDGWTYSAASLVGLDSWRCSGAPDGLEAPSAPASIRLSLASGLLCDPWIFLLLDLAGSSVGVWVAPVRFWNTKVQLSALASSSPGGLPGNRG